MFRHKSYYELYYIVVKHHYCSRGLPPGLHCTSPPLCPPACQLALLRKYPGRWSLMHLKDLRKGVVGDASGRTDLKNDVAIGTGQMNWPAILKTAQETGVKYYFIEDESPSVIDQVPRTLKFLEQVKF